MSSNHNLCRSCSLKWLTIFLEVRIRRSRSVLICACCLRCHSPFIKWWGLLQTVRIIISLVAAPSEGRLRGLAVLCDAASTPHTSWAFRVSLELEKSDHHLHWDSFGVKSWDDYCRDLPSSSWEKESVDVCLLWRSIFGLQPSGDDLPTGRTALELSYWSHTLVNVVRWLGLAVLQWN